MSVGIRAVRRVGHGLLAIATLAVCGPWVPGLFAADEVPPPEAAATAETAPAKDPVRLMARCSDGSLIKVLLLDEKIPLKTDYGLLEIPASDIERIEFATRVPADARQKIEGLIAELGSTEFDKREAAGEALQRLGAAAYQALLTAVHSEDPEVVVRADRLLEQLRRTTKHEDLQFNAYDVIYTAKSQLGGVLQVEALQVETSAFGKQPLRVELLRSLGLGEGAEVEPKNVMPDPGTLANFQGQTNRTFFFRVTGPMPNALRNGAVWGSDVYTFDSMLSLAAVHAGVLQPGETKVVGVTMLGAQNSFAGSARNGVTSGNWGAYPAAYRFVTKNAVPGRR